MKNWLYLIHSLKDDYDRGKGYKTLLQQKEFFD